MEQHTSEFFFLLSPFESRNGGGGGGSTKRFFLLFFSDGGGRTRGWERKAGGDSLAKRFIGGEKRKKNREI